MSNATSRTARKRAERARESGARKGRTGRDAAPPSRSLRFTRVNAMLGAAGLLTLALGYWLLAQESITTAPLLLVLAYVVLLPMAIIR